MDTHAIFKFMPIESIHKRIHSLQFVGVDGLSRLTVKCPDVLTSQKIKASLYFLVNDYDFGLNGKFEPV